MKLFALVFASILFSLSSLCNEGIDNPNFKETKVFSIETTINTIDDVITKLSDISTLKSVQYYSNTREKWETLYHEACFIKTAENKECTNIHQVVAGKSYYCLLQDNSLGDCVFRVTYRKTVSSVIADFVLIEPIKTWGITGIQANDLHIQLHTSLPSQGNTIQAKIYIEARYKGIPYIESTLTKSLNARLDALHRWMTQQLQNHS